MARPQMSGPEMVQLRDLLFAAFDEDDFEGLLLGRFDKRLDRYAARSERFHTALLSVIKAASRELWWRALVDAASAERPEDPGLAAFARRSTVPPTFVLPTGERVEGRRLEAYVSGNTPLDIVAWRTRLLEIEGRVCQVSVPAGRNSKTGTGFLVGPSLVLTAYHVLERVLAGAARPADVTVRFDHKRAADGRGLEPATVLGLHREWLVTGQPGSRHDLERHPTGEPGPDELDFALLRLDGRPGDEPAETTDPRGWLRLPPGRGDPDADPVVYIVQHPKGEPMQVAFGKLLGHNRSGTRVRYTAATACGSSGGPCFGSDGELLAMHHSGDADNTRPAAYNEGIPIAALRAATLSWNTGAALEPRA
ncbi:trypsin-like peptidase domain-containing protein [Dactylosporangium sp. CS-047395]|uniref:trypsin-like peptidase domain-containing protein n=1 Tax=Dactylosporangium sp. CS-047395 TaxID=3239936 RepID=UPI003D923683